MNAWPARRVAAPRTPGRREVGAPSVPLRPVTVGHAPRFTSLKVRARRHGGLKHVTLWPLNVFAC